MFRVISASLALALGASPALAQEAIDPELERLVGAGLNPRTAVTEAAKQQAEGDLLGAAATLERALIASPGSDAVRIEYVAILCKLDDRGSARVEFGLLRNRIVGGAAWSRMVAACGEDFAAAQPRTGAIHAGISAGLAVDSNAAEQLATFNLYGNGSPSGLAFVGSAHIDARIGAGSGFVYGNAFALTHNDLSGPVNDYQFGKAAIGYGKEFGDTTVAAGAVINHGRLFDASYVTAYGGQARFAWQTGSASQIFTVAEVVHEDYAATGDFNGTHYDLMVGYDVATGSRRRYFIGVGAELKETGIPPSTYKGGRLVASVELPLDARGMALNGSLTVRRIVFDHYAGSHSRKEWRLFSRLAIGIPLVGQRLLLEPAMTYRLRDYNAASFLSDYSSMGSELRLVWKL